MRKLRNVNNKEKLENGEYSEELPFMLSRKDNEMLKDLLKNVANPTIQQLFIMEQIEKIKNRKEQGESLEELNILVPKYVALGQSKEIRSLAELGADLDTLDGQDRSPVDWAHSNGHTETLNVLAESFELQEI